MEGAISFGLVNENIPAGTTTKVEGCLYSTDLPPEARSLKVTINSPENGTNYFTCAELFDNFPEPVFSGEQYRIVIDSFIGDEVADSENAIITFNSNPSPEPQPNMAKATTKKTTKKSTK